jgi:hypothetical protein
MTEAEWWAWARSWRDRLPSAEHRRHQRLFRKSTDTDEEDLRSRGYCVWKQLEHRLQSLRAATVQKTTRAKRGRRD